MMRDGIYKVSLEAGDRTGLIIGSVYDGAIVGCDETHFVTGTVTRKGNRVRGTFHLTRHSRRPDFEEIANLDEIKVRFAGIASDCFGEFNSQVAGKPGLKVRSTFQWLCEN